MFQPIVDVASGAPSGYEALTRFSDGTAPDRVFAEARASGLEVELELATLAAAIAAATALPADAWLSLNVSPGLLTANGRLSGALRRADRPIVLEVTEHVAVDDYRGPSRGDQAGSGPGSASPSTTSARGSPTSATSSSCGRRS